MIDTIILTIPKMGYYITDHSKFDPSTEHIERARGFFRCYNNPTAADRNTGNYKPRLTAMKRFSRNGIEYPLKIEFSAAKILFNNNLDEVEERDFNEVVKTLKTKIAEMGVSVSEVSIRNAEVSAFHASKNIPLSDHYTATLAIKELAKVNLNQKLDLDKASFRNDGHSLQYYSKAHSLVFYDKISDLKKSESRAIDTDQAVQQLNLLDLIKESKRSLLEVLKMEVRLSNKRKMNEVLERLGYQENPKFSDIFNKELCQDILRDYWKFFIEDKGLFVFDMNNNPQNILKQCLETYPRKKAKQVIYLVGLNLLCKDNGIRPLRGIIGQHRPDTKWPKISQDIALFKRPIFTKSSHGFIRDIQNTLANFPLFRIDTHSPNWRVKNSKV